MSFYHVIIGLKSRPQKDAIAGNLLEEDLMNNILKPHRNHEKFRCGDDIVVPDDISSIKITASENYLRTGYFVSKEQDYADLWQAVNQQKDVTDKFIKTLPQRKKETIKEAMPISKNVFIVHGKDHKPMKELKTMLKKFGLNPIVLHEKASGGLTLAEKLEKYSEDVWYAFVILTPDDVGALHSKFVEIRPQLLVKRSLKSILDLKPRARQNVIFEMGYFWGLLKRKKVCCLLKGDVEKPSDIEGIVYIPFKDSINKVRDIIVKELKAAGYEIKM